MVIVGGIHATLAGYPFFIIFVILVGALTGKAKTGFTFRIDLALLLLVLILKLHLLNLLLCKG